ncbi:sialic acid TRAP transporter substrate-binding protein SiaP [Amorphus orientalis]|uniref:TRAP-type C4-dicarboxylate transport system substrate-binding protein n=1 Tax=Amorphus orientalis TaxID=649198 RepID=A0AAE3VQG5_9HYPH|nr:sialic acid TRAP transporter substrate-binding protein SiaP [Amorphus orientalis]MDQ0315876.1 TRAP-type C4-dicarboxylate transport system substrate-binding protein [Amorphus orientalis]
MKLKMMRGLSAAGAALVAATMFAGGAVAQDPVKLTFADVTQANAPRSVALTDIFAKEIGDEFEFEPYFGGTLLKQGSELTAIRRGNLDMALLPPSDLANQVPEFSILSAAYLVRDADHLNKIFESDIGEEFRQLAREELGVEILAPAYYGTRQVNLRGDKKIQTPEDMNGIKLRMPGGESWQFLGESIGANPVPMPYTEVYTGLQTGVIDGQDNPLPNDKQMKFYEVTDQIVLTSHNVGFGLLLINADLFASLSEEQQERMRAAAQKAFEWSDQQYLDQEEDLVEFFKQEGLEVYTPDVEAFRKYSNQKYRESSLSDSWPDGMLERINAL